MGTLPGLVQATQRRLRASEPTLGRQAVGSALPELPGRRLHRVLPPAPQRASRAPPFGRRPQRPVPTLPGRPRPACASCRPCSLLPQLSAARDEPLDHRPEDRPAAAAEPLGHPATPRRPADPHLGRLHLHPLPQRRLRHRALWQPHRQLPDLLSTRGHPPHRGGPLRAHPGLVDAVDMGSGTLGTHLRDSSTDRAQDARGARAGALEADRMSA